MNTAQKLIVKNEEQRIVSGVIAEPFVLDTVSDFFSRAGIIKMYSDFITQELQENIDKEHNNILTGSEMIRTYIALNNDPDDYPEGAWIGECKIKSEADWDAVKRGEINGFSVEITTTQVGVTVAAERMLKAEGTTEMSLDTVLPAHTHTITITFDALGKVIKSETDSILGHTHTVTKCTATDFTLGHSHRLLLER